MKKYGKRWTILDVCKLYNLLTSSSFTLPEIEVSLGRSYKAIEFKLINGGLVDENLNVVDPLPSLYFFLTCLREKRQYELPQIPANLTKGKLSLAFKRKAAFFENVATIPANKGFLVPSINKWVCKERHKNSSNWWRFAHRAQSNPFVKSFVYRRENGLCALCGHALSEGEYQAHHSCYDHFCTFSKSIYARNEEGKRIAIPDCESCSKTCPYKFQECLKRLYAVHGACNKFLHEAEK